MWRRQNILLELRKGLQDKVVAKLISKLIFKVVAKLVAKLVLKPIAKALFQVVLEVLPAKMISKGAPSFLLLGNHPPCGTIGSVTQKIHISGKHDSDVS